MNPVQEWILSDRKLRTLIEEIESTNKSYSKMSEMAFEGIAKLYKIPKMPQDINDQGNNYLPNRSLFEEYALIKYLSEENTDPRSLVLSAAWHLVNNRGIDLKEVIVKEFGSNTNNKHVIGIRGTGANGEVVFPEKENKSWFELGCIVSYSV